MKKYVNRKQDLNRLSQDIESYFNAKNYEIQSKQAEKIWLIQARKKQGWRKMLGASRALTITIRGDENEFTIDTETG